MTLPMKPINAEPNLWLRGNVVAYNKRLKQIIINCESNVGEMLLQLINNSFYSLKYIDCCKKQCNEVIRHQSCYSLKKRN
jgi:hypothetical protein